MRYCLVIFDMAKEDSDIQDKDLDIKIDESEKEVFKSWLPEDELWRKNDTESDNNHAIRVENWDPVPDWISDWLNWYKDPNNEGKKYW